VKTLLDTLPVAVPYLPDAVVEPIARLYCDHQVFRQETGAAWRYRGVSAFPFIDRWARGDDVTSFLAAFPGYNTLRIWPYVPREDWGDAAWDAPSNAVIAECIRWCGTHGWYVELTLLTDDDPHRLPWAQTLVDDLAAQNLPNLLLEIGNEPLTHKTINCDALRDVCEGSPYLYSSGIYEDETQCFGNYGTAHTPRDSAWARKAHDLMEYYNGAGPNKPHNGLPWPWVGDEPIRPDQIGGDPRQRALDYRAHGAICSLLGAGATFHFEGGKHLELPTDVERDCAKELLTGLLAYPADAPRGPYNRIVEPGADDQHSRCYVVGPWMARARPPQPTPPAGYVALDPEGIICRHV